MFFNESIMQVMKNEWVDVAATLQRPSPQPSGVCANSQDVDDTIYFQLHPGIFLYFAAKREYYRLANFRF